MENVLRLYAILVAEERDSDLTTYDGDGMVVNDVAVEFPNPTDATKAFDGVVRVLDK